MKVSQLIQMDCRKPEAMDKLHEALFRLPFFKNNADVPTTDELEGAIKKMQKKYPIVLAYITTSAGANKEEPAVYYTLMVKETVNHQHVKTVWSMTLHEGLAKVALLMYGYIQKLKKEGSQ